MVRTSYGYDDLTPPIATWAARNGSRKAYVLVSDYAPGHDAEAAFIAAYKKAGGEIVGSVRTPVMTVDFSPFMQRVKDAQPDVLFAFVNGGDISAALFKEYRAKGLDQAGIKLIGTGDIVDDANLEMVGDRALDTVSVYPYSLTHKSELNTRFIEDYKKVRPGTVRPSIMSITAYDGMALVYEALKKTNGSTDGTTLVDAMKGLKFESPRGNVSVDPNTRDLIQTKYIRRVVKKGNVLENSEFEAFKAAAE